MNRFPKLAAIVLGIFALASLPATAADPLVYGSDTGYAGTGKHPKTGVTGLILDGRTQGTTFVCYDYVVITSDKIKGQVSGIAERISGNSIERIASYSNNKVQAFDFNQAPPGADTCGVPVEQPGFNLGIASDCAQVDTALAAGDIVRWTLKFKKGSKLKGRDSFIQISGSVLPFASLSSASAARSERLMRRIEGSGRDLSRRR